jgi:hypothetical protein
MAIGPHFVLLLVSVVLFAVAAAWNPQPAPPRYSLTAAGLCFFALAWLFP